MIEHQEIERKYLIRRPDEAILAQQENCEVLKLNQVYLTALRDNVRRLRKLESNGETRYFFTEKRNITDLGFRELEREITKKEYDLMMYEADPKKSPIDKTRYTIKSGDFCLDIDIYPFWKNQAILEIDLDSDDIEAPIPAWIEVIRNVTGEFAYRNSILAEHVPEEE